MGGNPWSCAIIEQSVTIARDPCPSRLEILVTRLEKRSDVSNLLLGSRTIATSSRLETTDFALGQRRHSKNAKGGIHRLTHCLQGGHTTDPDYVSGKIPAQI